MNMKNSLPGVLSPDRLSLEFESAVLTVSYDKDSVGTIVFYK